MAFEDVLIEVGEFGAYQKRLSYLFLFPVSMSIAWLAMPTYFLIASPDHWCYVPKLSNLSMQVQHELIRPIKFGKQLDQCKMYDIDYESLSVNEIYTLLNQTNRTLPVKECDRGWLFDHKYYEATAVTELNLVCSRSIWVSNILTANSIGMVFGTWIFAALSDKYGRHHTFYLTVLTALISNASPLLFTSLTSFTIFRFVNGLILPAIFHLPYIISLLYKPDKVNQKFMFKVTELVGPSERGFILGASAGFWAVGACSLPLVVYLTRNWINLTLFNVLVVLPILASWSFLPESPRWLLSEGRIEDLFKVLAKIAIVNGKQIPINLRAKIKEMIRVHQETENVKASPIHFLKKGRLRTNFLLIMLAIVAEDSGYYGLTLNFENLEGNPFVNFFMLSLVEIPSSMLAYWTIETRLGRRWSNTLYLTLGGILLCLPICLPIGGIVTTVVSFLAKGVVNTSLLVTYQQAAELYPTSLRNQGIGINVSVGCIVTLFLPYLSHLGRENVLIPLTSIGVICVIAGLASVFLPETLNENLPQEIHDAQQFGKGVKFFSLAVKRDK